MKMVFALILAMCSIGAFAADQPFYLGGDISALPDLEKAGAVYRDHDKPGDCITILHDHGCNLFRVRLFVNPIHDRDKAGGATQDLPMVLALAKRIKDSGAKFSLAIHYSDTWADPGKQYKPAAWNDLPMDALKQKVTDYTTDVMRSMKANGTVPDIVEVGNETRVGMLWPEGKLDGKTAEEKQLKWDNYASLEKAAIAGVRSQLPTDRTRILIHIDSGGRGSTATWFFGNLKKYNLDFDIIGLSFYPTWGDSMDILKKNLVDLPSMGKDILIIETGYPHEPVKQRPTTTWPMTPAGQQQFLNELISAVKATPDHRGLGVVWWYPEAVTTPGHQGWGGEALALFDQKGNLLPALGDR
jgi:arabinogalactan endo-1,4-beta-galactosidase